MESNKTGLIKYLVTEGKTDDISWDQLAKTFNFSSSEAVRSFWKWYKNKDKNLVNNKEILVDTLIEYEAKINNEKGEGTIKWISTKEVLTTEEIYKECKMDAEKWVMTQIWHKKRGTGFVYSADFKLIKQNTQDKLGKEVIDILNEYKSDYVKLSKQDILQNTKFADPCILFMSLTDAHIGRLATNGKTLQEQSDIYLNTLNTLLHKAYQSNFIDEIVYVVGNDLIDSDTFFGTTTNGTQQSGNEMWDKVYEAAFDCQVKAISTLKQFCNKLHVMFIPGNHARTKEFFLLHGLSVYFKGDKDIEFDRTADNTKVYVYGENFLAGHHGDTKPEKLPLYFASKYYKQWGEAKYKFIFLGDKHHKQGWNLKINQTEDEIEGVRICMTPALCGNSQWEKQNLYDTGIAAGVCSVYSKKKGRVMEIEEKI